MTNENDIINECKVRFMYENHSLESVIKFALIECSKLQPLPTKENDHIPDVGKMVYKKITVLLMRKLEKQVLQGEISYSRMVEILNETLSLPEPQKSLSMERMIEIFKENDKGFGLRDDIILVCLDMEELNQACEQIHQEMQQGNDAVELNDFMYFIKWAANNGWIKYEGDNDDWFMSLTRQKLSDKTTQELYQLYKQSKNYEKRI